MRIVVLVLAALAVALVPSTRSSAQSGRLPTPDEVGRYVLEPTHASLTWRIRHMGLSNYTARFTRFEAWLDLDPSALERTRLDVTVDPGSVETDYRGTDKDWTGELRNDARFFNARRFPEIRFLSTAVRRTGPNTAEVTGDLTLLGVTRPLKLDVTLNGSLARHPHAGVPSIGFSARGVVRRSEWGLTYGVGDDLVEEAEVIVEAEFLRTGTVGHR